MKRKKSSMMGFSESFGLVIALIATLAIGMTDLVYADAGCCLASATGTGIKAKTPVVNKSIGSSSIGCNGGSKTTSFADVEIPGLLDAIAVESSANGTTTQTSSSARVDNFTVLAGDNVIKATQVSSNAQAVCSGNPSASSNIQNLTINGQPVQITGEPNQIVPITGGNIIINAQQTKVAGCVKNISVTALKIQVARVADVLLSYSQAGVACVTFNCQ